MSHPRLAVYARQANGQVAPLRVIEGQRTALTRSSHGIHLDLVNDEIIVPSNLASAVLVFGRGARGNVAAERVIIGLNTRLVSPQGVAVDNTNNELVVSNDSRNGILVFERTANGDVAPLREIIGPSTGLLDTQGIAVDPVHDEIIIANAGDPEAGIPASILVFPRTANGDVAPIRKITGPNTGILRPRQLQLDLANDEIVLADRHRVQEFVFDDPGFIGVWNRTDNGDVPPKRFIRGPLSGLTGPRSVYVDTVNNEIGAGDTTSHAIFIYPRDF